MDPLYSWILIIALGVLIAKAMRDLYLDAKERRESDEE